MPRLARDIYCVCNTCWGSTAPSGRLGVEELRDYGECHEHDAAKPENRMINAAMIDNDNFQDAEPPVESFLVKRATAERYNAITDLGLIRSRSTSLSMENELILSFPALYAAHSRGAKGQCRNL